MKTLKFVGVMLIAFSLIFAMSCDNGSSSDNNPQTGGAATIVEDFAGTPTIGGMGWNDNDFTVVIADEALSITTSNYNAAAYVAIALTDGATLADYSSVSFDATFASGDLTGKEMYLYAFPAAPTSGLGYATDGTGYLASNASADMVDGTITFDISANTSDLAGTVYFAFGFNNSGAVWTADNFTVAVQ